MSVATEPSPAGQEPQPSGQEPPSDPQTQEPADDFDKERALATISKLRDFEKLSKSQARELEALRQQVKAHEDAKLSETEKLQARVAELEQAESAARIRYQEMTVRSVVEAQAAKAGAVYPDAAFKLIDMSEVEYAEDGTPKNIVHLIGEAKKAYPALFRAPTGSADGGTGGRQEPAFSMNRLIRQAAGRET